MYRISKAQKPLDELRTGRRTQFLDIPSSKYCYQKSYFSSNGPSFSILTYNVLADSYSSTTQFSRGCGLGFLMFSYRSEIIVEELRMLSSDIICLQEVDCDHSQFYKDRIESLGYKVIFAERRSDIPDGLLFGAKRDTFEILEHSLLKFDDAHKCQDKKAFKTGNIAIVARLKHKPSGEVINVITTHLHWDPQADQIKYLQMSEILTYVYKRYTKNDIIIWAGDLNSRPKSNLLRYVLDGSPPEKEYLETTEETVYQTEMEIYSDLELMRHIQWGNAYQNYGAASGDKTQDYPAYTTYTYRFKDTIDHILYSKEHLTPRTLLRIPSTSDKEIKTKTLPSKRYPSDHLPIMVKFEITPKTIR